MGGDPTCRLWASQLKRSQNFSSMQDSSLSVSRQCFSLQSGCYIMKDIDRIQGDAEARTLQYHVLVLLASMITIGHASEGVCFPLWGPQWLQDLD